MSLRAIDNYFQQQAEPARSTLLWLWQQIKRRHPELSEAWRYGMPFFDLDHRMFCYLWCDPKRGIPYIGFVDGGLIEHPALVQGDRKRMKVFLVDPERDVPVSALNEVMQLAIEVRKKKSDLASKPRADRPQKRISSPRSPKSKEV